MPHTRSWRLRAHSCGRVLSLRMMSLIQHAAVAAVAPMASRCSMRGMPRRAALLDHLLQQIKLFLSCKHNQYIVRVDF